MPKLFGFSALQLLGTLLVAGAVMHFVGAFAAFLIVALISAAIHFRAIKAQRPEAAWEITEQGTRELWNDGPRAPTRREIKP
ncbi:hypothetical protein p1D19 (plasmid) [Aromatoleum aromaticum EbN1]|jgi:hypothetical protein|uniref:Transmembrane protein n=1 Tax=Aromatoleum aromaticum (strain DSM 19018 / LMG 30748 / EbN1) TaxID=76114 RepID=Q5NWZ3_AROAE|nr:hypothetical protein [Aromatoleum aromaticum]CAI10421.1 hypothetical protein p1D19 [Aromatoleum aromaticum EbN1]